MTTNYGWIRINNSDSFKIACENIAIDIKFENSITNLPLDMVIGFSFGETTRIAKITNARFKTMADAESCLSQIQALQETGTPYLFQWQTHSDGGASNYFAFDGTNRSMYVLCDKISGISKVPGDETIFTIPMLQFTEASKS